MTSAPARCLQADALGGATASVSERPRVRLPVQPEQPEQQTPPGVPPGGLPPGAAVASAAASADVPEYAARPATEVLLSGEQAEAEGEEEEEDEEADDAEDENEEGGEEAEDEADDVASSVPSLVTWGSSSSAVAVKRGSDPLGRAWSCGSVADETSAVSSAVSAALRTVVAWQQVSLAVHQVPRPTVLATAAAMLAARRAGEAHRETAAEAPGSTQKTLEDRRVDADEDESGQSGSSDSEDDSEEDEVWLKI